MIGGGLLVLFGLWVAWQAWSTLDSLALSLQAAPSLQNLAFCVFGVSLGMAVGVIPGLGASVSELFGGSVGSEDIQVVRAGERVTVTPTGSGAPHLEAFGIKSDKLSSFVLHPQEESQAVGHGSVHTGEECVYVLKGEVEVSFEGRSERLSAQDCVHFSGIVPHKIGRIGSAEAVVLVIVVNGDL
ncbi:MAG: cupin domain-containing protein [Rhodobacteraceae bacterium]|nr:cupin domain-containing protein [Paracoccaceae bacterium]